ncbi:MAG: cell division protein SepF [Solirubrobacterales bacterium]
MSLVDKVWRWFGVGDMMEEEIIELPLPEDRKSNKKNNLVALDAARTVKVVVCEPASFEESQSVADNLKSRRQVILNMEHTQPDVSQRIIDFISGVTYALDGSTQKLGDNIFLFVPNNVEISKDPRTVMRNSYVYAKGGSLRGED